MFKIIENHLQVPDKVLQLHQVEDHQLENSIETFKIIKLSNIGFYNKFR